MFSLSIYVFVFIFCSHHADRYYSTLIILHEFLSSFTETFNLSFRLADDDRSKNIFLHSKCISLHLLHTHTHAHRHMHTYLVLQLIFNSYYIYYSSTLCLPAHLFAASFYRNNYSFCHTRSLTRSSHASPPYIQ